MAASRFIEVNDKEISEIKMNPPARRVVERAWVRGCITILHTKTTSISIESIHIKSPLPRK